MANQVVYAFIASCPQCLTLITVYVPLTLKLIWNWNNGQPQVEVTGEAIYDSHFCNLN